MTDSSAFKSGKEVGGGAAGERTKFTPGPWRVAGGRITPVRVLGPTQDEDGWGTQIALINAVYNQTADNARLIAAAPDMYEALKKARDEIASSIESEGVHEPEYSKYARGLVAEIDRILARAEGRSPAASSDPGMKHNQEVNSND